MVSLKEGFAWPDNGGHASFEEVVEFAAMAHMGPVTHPEVVNEAIGPFLERN